MIVEEGSYTTACGGSFEVGQLKLDHNWKTVKLEGKANVYKGFIKSLFDTYKEADKVENFRMMNKLK